MIVSKSGLCELILMVMKGVLDPLILKGETLIESGALTNEFPLFNLNL